MINHIIRWQGRPSPDYEMAAALAAADGGDAHLVWTDAADDPMVYRHMLSAGIGVRSGEPGPYGVSCAYPGARAPARAVDWEWRSGRLHDLSGRLPNMRPPVTARRFTRAACARPAPTAVLWAPCAAGYWDGRLLSAIRAGIPGELVVGVPAEVTEERARELVSAHESRKTTVIVDKPGTLWALLSVADVLIDTGGPPDVAAYTALSAMARGIPVVALAGSPAAQLLEEHAHAPGRVVSDVDQATTAAGSLLADLETYRALSNGAARTALQYEAMACLHRIRELLTMNGP